MDASKNPRETQHVSQGVSVPAPRNRDPNTDPDYLGLSQEEEDVIDAMAKMLPQCREGDKLAQLEDIISFIKSSELQLKGLNKTRLGG